MTPKAFIDCLPDWLDDIDLADPFNYKYQFAIDNFHRLRELRGLFGEADGYGEWIITDRTGLEPQRRIPCCRRDGRGWQPAVEEAFPRATERRTDQWVDMNGKRFYLFRFDVGCNVVTPYCPQSPAWLAAQAEKRKAKRLRHECAAMPLFGAQIAEEATA